MYALMMISGALILAAGYFFGRRSAPRDNGREVYKRLYGKTSGLYEPVRRSGRKTDDRGGFDG